MYAAPPPDAALALYAVITYMDSIATCQYQRRILSHIAVTGPLISRMNGTGPAQSHGAADSGVESDLPRS